MLKQDLSNHISGFKMDSPPQASVGMSYQQVHPWDYLIKQLQDELDSSELTTLMIYMQGPEVDDDSDDHSMEQHYDEKVKQMFQKMMTKGTFDSSAWY